MRYKNIRKKDFKNISIALKDNTYSALENSLVICGDSLELIKSIPSNSISLILTDPPYHATKKKNIYGDTHFKKDQCYLEWMKAFSIEWKRVLRPNGAIFCFCDSSMAARLESIFSESFNILSHIVWTKPNEPGFDGWKGKMKKESLRQWYGHSERILFAEPAVEGNLHRSFFAQYLREIRKTSELSGHQLTELVGAYGKVNHGGAVSNWEAGRNTPSREQYEKIKAAILQTGKVRKILCYEDAIRPFIIDGSKQFTDVWTFPSVKPYKGKHPAEKPIDMLKHAIEATTYPGDIVLDCFGGSGSTLQAALETKRRTISIEIEQDWVNRITDRAEACHTSIRDQVDTSESKPRNISNATQKQRQSLFSL